VGAPQPPSLIGMIVHALYASVASLTGMAGLTPLQAGAGVLVLLVALLGVQFYMAASDRRAWSLDDEGSTDA
jgi:hypothetical protein